MNAEPGATVFVVDDDASVRRSLARLLRSLGYRVEVFASADEYLQRGQSRPSPCCLLLDVRMPGIDGLALQERLGIAGTAPPIVFLTGHGTVPMGVSAIKRGAVDFLIKPVQEQDLLRAIGTALEKDRADTVHRERLKDIKRRIAALTDREYEVMTYVVAGALNKQIADRLGIAEKTVKVHRGRVMEKVGVASVAELVRICDVAGVKIAALK